MARHHEKMAVQPLSWQLEAALEQSWPGEVWRDTHVVLAVSGGADSVAMLRAVNAVKQRMGGAGRVFVAHLNHRARGQESNDDAGWVENLCEELGLEAFVEAADVEAVASAQRDGWEMAARAVRYDFLRRTAERLGARYVAMAHTVNDQVETILHRILRGTGVEGLRGIPHVRPLSTSVVLVRPLLSITRRQVLDYLVSIGQAFRNDISNSNLRWTRNRLRHEFLPGLREYYRDVDTALLQLAAKATEVQRGISEIAQRLEEECATYEWGEIPTAGDLIPARRVVLNCEHLAGESLFIVREVIRTAWRRASWGEQAMGFEQWQQLALLAVDATQAASVFPGNLHARRKADRLIIELPGFP